MSKAHAMLKWLCWSLDLDPEFIEHLGNDEWVSDEVDTIPKPACDCAISLSGSGISVRYCREMHLIERVVEAKRIVDLRVHDLREATNALDEHREQVTKRDELPESG